MEDLSLKKYSEKALFILPEGYLNKELGEKILSTVKKIAVSPPNAGFVIIISMKNCSLINSLGLGKLIETIEIADESGVKLWFSDLAEIHNQTLEASGVINIIAKITTTEQSLSELEIAPPAS